MKDEPIKDIFDNIVSSLVEQLTERVYGGDSSKIPTIDYLGAQPTSTPVISGVERVASGSEVTYTIGDALPEPSAWLETLAGPELSWSRALITSPLIVQGSSFIDNPIRRLLNPRRGQKIVVSPASIKLYGAARSFGPHQDDFQTLNIAYTASSGVIEITIFEERRGVSVPLALQFQYKPSMGSAPIHEIAEGRNQRIKAFYWKLWYGDNETLPAIDIKETFIGPEVTIEAEAVETFCAVVGNQGEHFKSARTEEVKAPMDFAIVTGWQVSQSAFHFF